MAGKAEAGVRLSQIFFYKEAQESVLTTSHPGGWAASAGAEARLNSIFFF